MPDDRPNILWYCTDQQRADTLGFLGNPHVVTPNLDRFAESACTFTRAYTQSPICTPARASFLTGRYPSTHHAHRNGAARFPSSEVLVTRLLADAGYDCGLVGKLHIARAEGGVEERTDDGYRLFDWSHHPFPARNEDGRYGSWLREEKGIDPEVLYDSLSGDYGPGVPEEVHQTTWCTEAAIRFATEERDGPWMLSVNSFDPHPPFLPPPELLEHYDPRSLPYPLFREQDVERQKRFRDIDQGTREAINPFEYDGAARDPEEGGGLKAMPGSVPPTRYDARVVKAHYYACVELVDRQFGRLLEALGQSGQLANTIVIFTSDHGELLGDHGLMYKGCRFFEALVRVPLLVSWPGHYRTGARSPALVELVDLAPTLLEAAGMDVPYYMQGRSLTPVLAGETERHKDYVVSEYNDATSRPGASHGSMYFDGRYKICSYHGHEVGEIYDLQEDPGEFENLWFDPERKDLKLDLLKRHFDAMMLTSSAGIERTGKY